LKRQRVNKFLLNFNFLLNHTIESHVLSKRSSSLQVKHSNERCFDFPKLQELVFSIPQKMNFLTEHEDLTRKLIAKRDVIVRVYILDLEELANRDNFVEGENGMSDPYVTVYLENDDKDNKPQGDEKDYKENVRDVRWAKHYE